MTHYVCTGEVGWPVRAICGAIVLRVEDYSIEPECQACQMVIVEACRQVAAAWVLPWEES